jgi:4-azaleucine resistance transporter AzlC
MILRRDVVRGIKAAIPLAPGIGAFGILYGVTARQVGFAAWEAVAMSLIVHAGASQFAALNLWNSSSPMTIIITTWIINLRHMLLAASIAPHLADVPRRWKGVLAYHMSDESYAITIAAYEQGHGSPGFFLGANIGTTLTWLATCTAGALLGSAIPDPQAWGLDLVFPLAFMALLTAFVRDRPSVAAAVVGGGLALAGALWLPGNAWVIVAGLAGSAVGLLLERNGQKDPAQA